MQDDSGIRCYRETAVQTIGPEKLIVLLYEGLIRYLTQARAAIVARDMAGKSRSLNSAQAVVLELRNALAYEAGGDLAANLASLYNFVFAENVNALLDNDPRHLDNGLRVLRPLLDAWSQIPPGTAERARRELAGPVPDPASPPAGPDPAMSPSRVDPASAYGRPPGAVPAAPPPTGVLAGLSITV